MEELYKQIENYLKEKRPELDFELIECVSCNGYRINIIDPGNIHYSHVIRDYDDFLNLMSPATDIKQITKNNGNYL